MEYSEELDIEWVQSEPARYQRVHSEVVAKGFQIDRVYTVDVELFLVASVSDASPLQTIRINEAKYWRPKENIEQVILRIFV